ncbi:MAG: alpha-mannosidase [Phycisphaerales bacterium]|nr:alpha-mannosidase [Phycisphaerales bacterium]
MDTDPIRQSDRFARFCSDVLDPAPFRDPAPLSAEVFQSDDPVPPARAPGLPYAPAAIGFRWGPKWSTAWFRLTGTVPASHAGNTTVLRFDTGVEAQLWRPVAGAVTPVQGFDVNRDSAVVLPRAGGAERLELFVEAACNPPFGVGHFPWDPPDAVRRWNDEKPARLDRAELAVFDERLWRLAVRYRFAALLLRELPPESPRAQQLIAGLRQTTNAIDDTHVAETADAALAILDELLASPAPGSATLCHATGHAHIDTAWLWPIRETRRKCIRSFSNVLRLMDRFEGFRFLCSQAQQYAYIEQDSPELFAQIAERVKQRRWEPGGAMWIEPDANCPSGESLVRQILHGTRYWQDKFGDAAKQRFVYLPDTFGFPAILPQIIAKAGLDTFITNKLAWNAFNHYPHTSFLWRGLDGTDILTHFTPGADYNAVNTPLELRRGEKRHADTHLPGREPTRRWRPPVAYGDGGGGPTDRSIEYARIATDCDGLPKTRLSRTDDFCEALHADFDALRARAIDPPVWDGELYLDLHRATLTTQAWLKLANRRAEELLRLAELLLITEPGAAFPPLPPPAGEGRGEGSSPPSSPTLSLRGISPEARATLDQAWKLLLLNQFHDILPGSSITWVYDDAKKDHAAIRELVQPLVDAGLDRWAGALGGAIVVNQSSHPQSGVVAVGEHLHYVADVPPMGARTLTADATPPPVTVQGVSQLRGAGFPTRGTPVTISNDILQATIGDDGALSSLRHLTTNREACAPGRSLNHLAIYEDRPRMWDAWDFDPEAEYKPLDAVGAPESIELVTDHPLRAAVRVTRAIGTRSRIEQTYTLDAGSPRLDIATRVEWHEDQRLLRALFPVAVRAARATYDLHFGHTERPTHRNTPWDRAKYEVCAHRWMDLAEPGFGVALLNDGKYGHSCHSATMGLTLLRAPSWPDPGADRGTHQFTYSLMPHAGDWRSAGVDRQAESLNTPLLIHGAGSGPAPRAWAPFTINTDGPVSLLAAAFKPAEDGDGLILRLVETHGGRGRATVRWTHPAASVEPTDLMECPIRTPAGFTHTGSKTEFEVKNFEIVTLRVRP